MAVHRTKASQRNSPEVEKLVADAISLAASGSQVEDRFWEERLNVRLMRLLKSQNQNVIDAALDQTFRINTVAFEVLADIAETLAESLTRPAIFTVPEFVLKIVLGEASTLLLQSPQVCPERLLNEGFKFNFPDIHSTIEEIIH